MSSNPPSEEDEKDDLKTGVQRALSDDVDDQEELSISPEELDVPTAEDEAPLGRAPLGEASLGEASLGGTQQSQRTSIFDFDENYLSPSSGDETFHGRDVEAIEEPEVRLGLLGGTNVGKTYLLNGMFHRLQGGSRLGGALAALISDSHGLRLFCKRTKDGSTTTTRAKLTQVLRPYLNNEKIASTVTDDETWFALDLPCNLGSLKSNPNEISIKIVDSRGEDIAQKLNVSSIRDWAQKFVNTDVMIFCLPLWVLFPGDHLEASDKTFVHEAFTAFEQIVENVSDAMKQEALRPVPTVLMLTMADDDRVDGGSELDSLQENWINDHRENFAEHMRQLRTPKGMMNYLSNAREMSEFIDALVERNGNASAYQLVRQLNFGSGKPWLIPVSAIDGNEILDVGLYADEITNEPVPVHVEFPILLGILHKMKALQ